MILLGIATEIYIVCLAVILCFGFAFLFLSFCYFKSKKKLFSNGLEDEEIKKEIEKDYPKIIKKKKNRSISDFIKRKEKGTKSSFLIYDIIVSALYGFLIVLVCFGLRPVFSNEHIFVFDKAMMIIETSSMETVSPNNIYLKENNLDKDEHRINHYSFVSIEKISQEQMTLYDVYAFKMYDFETKKDITIVHRLIEIKEKDGETLYTFRGDSNSSSLLLEKEIPFDRIIGRFSGYKNEFLGYLIVYLRSSIGIITITTTFLLLLIYSSLNSKLEIEHDKRYLLLFSDYIKKINSNFKSLVFNKIDEHEYSYSSFLNKGKVKIEGLDIPLTNYEIVLSKASKNAFNIEGYVEKFVFNKQEAYLLDETSSINFIGSENVAYSLLLKKEIAYKDSSQAMLFLYANEGKEND